MSAYDCMGVMYFTGGMMRGVQVSHDATFAGASHAVWPYA